MSRSEATLNLFHKLKATMLRATFLKFILESNCSFIYDILR